MQYNNVTNAELVRLVDNMPRATPLERELANRLDEMLVENVMTNAIIESLKQLTENHTNGQSQLAL